MRYHISSMTLIKGGIDMSSIIEKYFKEGEFYIERSAYLDRNRLAVVAYTKSSSGYPEDNIGALTVNLENEEVAEDEAFLDENNLPGIAEALIRLGLGTCNGIGFSGYCMYPRFKFDLDKLDKLTKEYENIAKGRSQE